MLVAIFWLDAWSQSAGAPPGIVLLVVGLLVCAAIALELNDMGFAKIGRSARGVGIVAALAGLCAMYLAGLDEPWASMAVPSAALATVMLTAHRESRDRSSDGTLAGVGASMLLFAYPGLALGCFLAIRHEHSAWIILWILITTKSSDIGAYFTGKAIGKHKLIPWLSPGKTWEGFFGGMVFAAATGGLGAWLLQSSEVAGAPSPLVGAILGAIIGVLGQLGDLLASMFKRDAGIKDSGKRIPGFGGMLDLADSTLLVGVAAYWVLVLT